MTVIYDDKRLIPEFGREFWCARVSERDWNYCKYCYRDTPTFILTEGAIGSTQPTGRMRCCWECGSGLQRLAATI
jgi:hypothetical protein